MREDSRVRSGLVLAVVPVAVGLMLEVFLPHTRAIGFGVIFGGWASLVLALVRTSTARRLRG